MIQLFYISTAKKGLTQADINAILEKSRKNNQKNDITGSLLFRGGIFLQLLEGDKTKIRNLIETKIKKDDRHTDIIEVFEEKCEERIFNDWSMGYCEISDIDLRMVNEVLSWNQLIDSADEIDKALILKMFERFKGKL